MDEIIYAFLAALLLLGVLAISESGPEQTEPQEIIRTYNR
jgi:hypothetical protein